MKKFLFILNDYLFSQYIATADFILKILGVYTHSMETIYLFLSAQVAGGTFFMKSLVLHILGNQREKGIRVI